MHPSLLRRAVALAAPVMVGRALASAVFFGATPFGAVLLAAPALAFAPSGSTPVIHLIGDRGGVITSHEVGDTLTVAVEGLTARAAFDLVLRDDTGAMLGFARAAATPDGELGPETLWWESGVTGPDPDGRGNAGDGFLTFADAQAFLANHAITVEVRQSDPRSPGTGPIVTKLPVPVIASRQSPLLWFSDARGNYRTSFVAGNEPILISGDHLPAGAVVDLFVVGDQMAWEVGDPLVDLTGYQGAAHKERVYLAPGSTSFAIPVWPAVYQRAGRFDLVARVNDPRTGLRSDFRASDLLFHGVETGLHVEPAATLSISAVTDIEAQLSGRRTNGNRFPGFRRQSVFLRHDKVFAALDPTDVPPNHPKPKAAAIYVVPARSAAQWAAYPRLADSTETVEFKGMKPGTLEMSITLIWTDPDPTNDGDKFDVVLDFRTDVQINPPLPGTPGTPPPGGNTSVALLNGIYDPGVDIIDHLDDDGFVVIDDPADTGPYPVGRTDYNFVDAYDIPYGQYMDQNVDMRAVVAYPGQAAGTNVPVGGPNGRLPIVLILHGNHNVCLSGACSCSTGRIPNHSGYDYLLDLWASHGFIAVSIDGYDITGCPSDRFIERGALILEHLRYWEDWGDSTIPDTTFNGRFYNRVDQRNVGIAGHSRGGEGVAAALQINQDIPLNHHIKAAVTIAPTDYNWSTPPGGGPLEFLVRDTPLFNIMGTSDGDVSSLDGLQIWDRAAPAGQRADKSQAVIYGADHNSWNTVWIDPAWNGGSEGVGSGRITAQQQQDTGRVFLTSWWMAWLQDRHEMLAFHKDIVQSKKLAAVETHWSYEAQNHIDIDDFEQTPADKFTNSLVGAVTATPAPQSFLESGFNPGNYDGSFYQQTKGLVLGWNAVTTYESEIPAAWQDTSPYSHVAFRVTQIWDGRVLNPGGSQHFVVNLEDVAGRRQTVGVDSRAYTTIPVSYSHPYTGRKSLLSSVRIPLTAFTQNSSGVDLTQIKKIIVTCESTGLLGFDDIQFTK